MDNLPEKIEREALKKQILKVFERYRRDGESREGYDCCMELNGFSNRYYTFTGASGSKEDIAAGLEACFEDGELYLTEVKSINGQKTFKLICR